MVVAHVGGADPAAAAPEVDHDVVLGPDGVAAARGHLLAVLARVVVHTTFPDAGGAAEVL